jgi:TonB family protein
MGSFLQEVGTILVNKIDRMKTKLIFLITVATFSVQAFAIQHNKDRQIHFQMQTQISLDNWSFKYCPPDSVVIEKQDSISDSEVDFEVQEDSVAIICWGGGSDAEFPGGMSAMGQFLMENIVINQSDSSQMMAGCQAVWVQISIDETGQITDVVVVKSAGNELDNAVIKVIKAMPKWIPATYKGENISTNYTLPIQIYLN